MGIRINALTETTSPGDTDNGVLDTSAGTRRITWSNIKTAIFGAINGLTSKSTPVGADVLVIGDSAASFAGKKAPLNSLARAITQYARISDTKAANTSGGGLTSGSYVTRTINTVDTDPDGIVSIASNQFTLQGGTYRIAARVPAYGVTRHKARLRNITDGSDALLGTSEYNQYSSNVSTSSLIVGQITIASAKTFEIQHRVEITNATNGGGNGSNFGDSEVYTVVEIWKVA